METSNDQKVWKQVSIKTVVNERLSLSIIHLILTCLHIDF